MENNNNFNSFINCSLKSKQFRRTPRKWSKSNQTKLADKPSQIDLTVSKPSQENTNNLSNYQWSTKSSQIELIDSDSLKPFQVDVNDFVSFNLFNVSNYPWSMKLSTFNKFKSFYKGDTSFFGKEDWKLVINFGFQMKLSEKEMLNKIYSADTYNIDLDLIKEVCSEINLHLVICILEYELKRGQELRKNEEIKFETFITETLTYFTDNVKQNNKRRSELEIEYIEEIKRKNNKKRKINQLVECAKSSKESRHIGYGNYRSFVDPYYLTEINNVNKLE
jgi:hypothetical protein